MNEDLYKLLYQDLSFEEAEAYFKKKLPITKEQYEKLASKYKQVAFTVSNYSSIQVVNQFYEEVIKAIETGSTLESFKEQMNTFLERNGYSATSAFQMEVIFRTNLQTAYNVGHYEQMNDEDVKRLRPYWQYDAVNDKDTRPTHQAMDGLVYRADDPFWDTWYPPNGYRCRCTVRSLSKRQVEERGLKVMDKMSEEIVPDEGFATNPAKAQFEPDISKYPKSLQTAYKNLTATQK